MDEFQQETARKAAIYSDNVGKIGSYLHTKFYKAHLEDAFDAYYDHEAEEIEKNACMDKAVRLYQFFSSVEEVKKMMEFLNTVNPGFAKDLVDGL